MAQALTADQILSEFETVIADSLDQTTELFLLNEVKDTIETERNWCVLKGLDQSQTANASDTWLTRKSLPADFALPSDRGIYIGTNPGPRYIQIPFEAQIDFQSITYSYFIDLYNSQYGLGGTVSAPGIIQFFYQRYSPTLALTANGGLPWIFPARFHPLLIYEMAIKYFAIDQGEKSRAWDDRWSEYATRLREAMVAWDDQLQSQALQAEQNFFVDPASFPTIVDMGNGMSGGGSIFG